MKESSTYQLIVREGREEEARRLLLLLGEKKFGRPDPAVQVALHRIGDLSRLEELAVRLLSAASWQELFQSLTPRRRPRRRGPGE